MAARISKDDFEEKVIKNELPVLVDFYSDSCVACKKLAPVLGDFEDSYENRIAVFKVNTNFDVEIAEKYQIKANPTLLLIKNGESVAKRSGALSKKDLEEWVLSNIEL